MLHLTEEQYLPGGRSTVGEAAQMSHSFNQAQVGSKTPALYLKRLKRLKRENTTCRAIYVSGYEPKALLPQTSHRPYAGLEPVSS